VLVLKRRNEMNVKTVYVFKNGNVAVFNEKGEQIPELQINLFSWMKKKGFNVICKELNQE